MSAYDDQVRREYRELKDMFARMHKEKQEKEQRDKELQDSNKSGTVQDNPQKQEEERTTLYKTPKLVMKKNPFER